MPYTPPTLQECIDNAASKIEARTNQSIPIYAKAMKRAIAIALGFSVYPIYKAISWARKQCFIISADEETLDNVMGPNERLSREGNQKLECTVTLTVSESSLISVTTTFENKQTGLYYFPKSSKTVTVEDNTIDIIADGYGTEYELSVDSSLEIVGGQILNVNKTATVTEILVYPTDKEVLEEWRRRCLLSNTGSVGGMTAADYRTICESVSGVKRAFPFSGRPDSPNESRPGDRSTFIEAEDNLGTNGVASEALLDSVTSAIRINQTTGMTNEPLGSTSSTLFVNSISLLNFDLEVYDLVCDESIVSTLRSKISSTVSTYFRSSCPFVFGVDPDWQRSDNVSSAVISAKIIGILEQYSSTCSKVVVYLDDEEISNRILIGGELARVSSIAYIG